MLTDLNDTCKMMMMKTQNGHNSANFETTTSRFCMVIDLNKTYSMMMMMMMMITMMMMMIMMMMMMKIQNGQN